MYLRAIEGIVWNFTFFYLIIWTIIPQIKSIRNSMKLQKVIAYFFSFMNAILFLLLHFILEIDFGIVLLLFVLYNLLFLLPSLLSRELKSFFKGEFNSPTIILSWFLHSVLYLSIALFLKSTIWVIGATIIFIAGVVNYYFETAVKKSLKFFDPNIKYSNLLFGFAFSDETPAMFIMLLSSILYFPLLFLFPNIAAIFQNLLNKLYTPILAFALFLFGTVLTVMNNVKKRGNINDFKHILAKIYRGFIVMGLVVIFIFPFFGAILNGLGIFDLSTAFYFSSDKLLKGKWPDFPILLNQIWFASIVTLFLGFIIYGIVITYLAMGGKSYKNSEK